MTHARTATRLEALITLAKGPSAFMGPRLPTPQWGVENYGVWMPPVSAVIRANRCGEPVSYPVRRDWLGDPARLPAIAEKLGEAA